MTENADRARERRFDALMARSDLGVIKKSSVLIDGPSFMTIDPLVLNVLLFAG